MQMRKSMLTIALSLFVLSGCQQSSGAASGTATPTDSPESTPAASVQPSASPETSAAPTSPSQGTSSEPAAGPAMTTVTAVRLADAKSGWLGGKGWIARTDDGGATWKPQMTVTGDVQQLFALNGQEAWAEVGDERKLLSTTDGGKHWSDAGKVPNGAFLHFVAKQEAYSGNAKTLDGGKTWTTLPVPEGITGDAYFHDKANGWAVRQVKDKIEVQRTQNGGKSWQTVMSRATVAPLTGTVIRSAGANDAWVELIGDSGMTQTSYSLFHTTDGGKTWLPVLNNTTAGGGPAPGYAANDTTGAKNTGAKPGPLDVVSPEIAFMGGQCPSCDKSNSVGSTKDGGKTWVNGKESFTGYGTLLLAMADGNQGWLITNDNSQPSVMYTTSNGGANWKKVHTFSTPK